MKDKTEEGKIWKIIKLAWKQALCKHEYKTTGKLIVEKFTAPVGLIRECRKCGKVRLIS
jgi:hypothetical protein